MSAVAILLLLAGAPAAADWRDVPDVKGVCSAGCGDTGGSSRSRREYIPPEPTPGSIAYDLGRQGRARQLAGDWAGAEQSYRAALEMDPGTFNGSVYAYQLGYSLLMQEKWTKAEAALRRSIALRPHYSYAHDNLAYVLRKLGRDAEAEEEYLGSLRAGPRADVQEELAGIVGRRKEEIRSQAFAAAIAKDGAEAEADWRKYLLVRPDDAAAHNNLAVALEDQGRYLEAEAEYRKAAELQPSTERYQERLTQLRANPVYGPMLTLAKAARHWSELAAGNKNEATRWLGMRCFDDGCRYSEERAAAEQLLAPAPARPAVKEPPQVRADPEAGRLKERAKTARKEYAEAADALKAVWSAKEANKTDPVVLDILEAEHRQAVVAKDEELRAAEEKVEKRYLDLGFVLPKAGDKP